MTKLSEKKKSVARKGVWIEKSSQGKYHVTSSIGSISGAHDSKEDAKRWYEHGGRGFYSGGKWHPREGAEKVHDWPKSEYNIKGQRHDSYQHTEGHKNCALCKKSGGTSTFKKQSRATRNSYQLPSNKILRPAKRKRDSSDYY